MRREAILWCGTKVEWRMMVENVHDPELHKKIDFYIRKQGEEIKIQDDCYVKVIGRNGKETNRYVTVL